ncbi:hypothetical protein T492DRAFT_1141403 [Pavlovales sp. CCMP2436]|nr:hypothetical protein T492DRAFT_1141403 [Pavlovales sp. CCMP2436]
MSAEADKGVIDDDEKPSELTMDTEVLRKTCNYALIKNCDMNEEMRQDCIELVITAIEKYQTNYEVSRLLYIIYSARDPSSSSVHNDVTPDSEPAVPAGTSSCIHSAAGPSPPKITSLSCRTRPVCAPACLLLSPAR